MMTILLLDRFDFNREPRNNLEIVFTSITVKDRLSIHKADYVFYVDEKSTMEPRYVNILKYRDTLLHEYFREVINKLIDRQHYLFELSRMFNTRLAPYELKDFIENEFTNYYGDEVEFLKPNLYHV